MVNAKSLFTFVIYIKFSNAELESKTGKQREMTNRYNDFKYVKLSMYDYV